MKYTLEQFMKLNLLNKQYGDDTIKLYAELAKLLFGKELNEIKKTDADIIVTNFISTLNEQPTFVQRFKHKGIEFGFIPNFDNMTVAEYVDIDSYSKDDINQANKLMAVLYRPITSTSGDNYQIEEYNGTSKYSQMMLEVDYTIYLSSMVFFWNLGNELSNFILTSSDQSTQS